MSSWRTRWLVLSVLSLLVMLYVDYVIGAAAEFLNAFSVLERLLGQTPSAGNSMLAKRIGPTGELAVVLVANLILGALLSWLVGRFLSGRK